VISLELCNKNTEKVVSLIYKVGIFIRNSMY